VIGNEMTEKTFITAQDVAEIWRITPQTVSKWMRDGVLSRYKISGTRLTRTTLEDVAAATVPANGAPGDKNFYLHTVEHLYGMYAEKHPDRELPEKEELRNLWSALAEEYEKSQSAA